MSMINWNTTIVLLLLLLFIIILQGGTGFAGAGLTLKAKKKGAALMA